MIELNISCPNVKDGGMAFGSNPKVAGAVTKAVKEVTKTFNCKIISKCNKYSWNCKNCRKKWSWLNLLNKYSFRNGHRYWEKETIVRNIFGGLSGPAIKPIALRMIYQIYKEIDIPIIGMGGISCAKDVLEFMLAGATMISIGTGIFQIQYYLWR